MIIYIYLKYTGIRLKNVTMNKYNNCNYVCVVKMLLIEHTWTSNISIDCINSIALNGLISNSNIPLSILSYINNSFKIWIASCNDFRISVINCWFLFDWNFDLSFDVSDKISSPIQALLRGVRNSWLISRTKVRLAFKLAYDEK